MNSKQAAIAAAKQVARESNEFLKSAREQIAPSPEVPRQEAQHTESVPDTSQRDVSNKNLSFLAEYKNELQEIEHESLFKELLKKISEGEEVPVEDFAKELSWEQRDVLKARIEAVKLQKEAATNRELESSLQIVAKKGRNAMMGMFKKKNETHVETRQPPSG